MQSTVSHTRHALSPLFFCSLPFPCALSPSAVGIESRFHISSMRERSERGKKSGDSPWGCIGKTQNHRALGENFLGSVAVSILSSLQNSDLSLHSLHSSSLSPLERALIFDKMTPKGANQCPSAEFFDGFRLKRSWRFRICGSRLIDSSYAFNTS